MKKYNRLVVYACSFGWNGSVNPPVDWYIEDSMPDVLSKKLQLPLLNRSNSGTNPDAQFKLILEDIHNGITSNEDFILVQWTHIDRIYSETYRTLMPHIDDENVKWFYEHVYDIEISANKLISYILSVDSLRDNFFHNFVDGKNYIKDHSSIELYKKMEDIKYVGFHDQSYIHYLWETAKDGSIIYTNPCCHPTSDGHRLLAEEYYKVINDYIK